MAKTEGPVTIKKYAKGVILREVIGHIVIANYDLVRAKVSIYRHSIYLYFF